MQTLEERNKALVCSFALKKKRQIKKKRKATELISEQDLKDTIPSHTGQHSPSGT